MKKRGTRNSERGRSRKALTPFEKREILEVFSKLKSRGRSGFLGAFYLATGLRRMLEVGAESFEGIKLQ
jgi:hypothetical protein